eukprot:4120054-Amphidinium_carterae.2
MINVMHRWMQGQNASRSQQFHCWGMLIGWTEVHRYPFLPQVFSEGLNANSVPLSEKTTRIFVPSKTSSDLSVGSCSYSLNNSNTANTSMRELDSALFRVGVSLPPFGHQHGVSEQPSSSNSRDVYETTKGSDWCQVA